MTRFGNYFGPDKFHQERQAILTSWQIVPLVDRLVQTSCSTVAVMDNKQYPLSPWQKGTFQQLVDWGGSRLSRGSMSPSAPCACTQVPDGLPVGPRPPDLLEPPRPAEESTEQLGPCWSLGVEVTPGGRELVAVVVVVVWM